MKEEKSLFLVLAAIIFLHSYHYFNRNQQEKNTGDKNIRIRPLSRAELTASFAGGNDQLEPENVARDEEMLTHVGERLTNAVNLYYASHGALKQLGNYHWQYRLQDNPKVNAWCLPGGHIIVNTGLLPVTKNESSLAFVLGHEIAHALFRTASFQNSRSFINAGNAIYFTPLFNCYGLRNPRFGSVKQFKGALLFQPEQIEEMEADKYGLLFTAMAGYDPSEAIAFWHRLESIYERDQADEILATHPTDEQRLTHLVNYLPTALNFYQPH